MIVLPAVRAFAEARQGLAGSIQMQSTTPRADVALLTDHRYAAAEAAADDWYLGNILADDRLLIAALADRGVSAMRLDWSRADVDWSQFRVTVFRTTWDYFDRPAEFATWLGAVEHQTRVCNPPSTIRWNMDKHYLADLASLGIPVVRSRYVERGSRETLHDLLDETGWEEAVIKPCISGAARHTYRVNRRTAAAIEPTVRRLLAVESLMLQPFERAIIGEGEDALMVFGGRFSHAVRKRAQPGDFRVQDDHGGTVHQYEASDEQISLAERAMAACSPTPVYGRVDMVRDNDGRLAIMELELIEPELWLRHHAPAAAAFAAAISVL